MIGLHNVTKEYETAGGRFAALKRVNFEVNKGEYVAIVGKSGSGKSTLLNMIAGIDRPSSGEVSVNRVQVQELDHDDAAIWRGSNVGVVFQFFQLLPTLTVIENVMLPMDFCGTYQGRERRSRAFELLDQFGIADQAGKLPATLSGGQQQRAAMARALANDPPIIVADEPTGNLDSNTAESVLTLFQALAKQGKTIVMVSHERDIAKHVTRAIRLEDGVIVKHNSDGMIE